MKENILLSLLILMILAGCAKSHAYNPNDPSEYRDHWEGNEEIKDNEFLYPFSEECKEERKNGNSC